jgi:hypothetical protein
MGHIRRRREPSSTSMKSQNRCALAGQICRELTVLTLVAFKDLAHGCELELQLRHQERNSSVHQRESGMSSKLLTTIFLELENFSWLICLVWISHSARVCARAHPAYTAIYVHFSLRGRLSLHTQML